MRAFIFTMDALISLIPITIALGITASLIFSATEEHATYSSEYEQFIDAHDFADLLIKKLLSAGLHTNATFVIIGNTGVPPAKESCSSIALNITEFWTPAKLKMIRNIAGDIGVDILDIGAFSKYASDSTVDGAYYINASRIADETKFKRSFRIAVISYREKVLPKINFSYVNSTGVWYYYNLWDKNSDGYVSRDSIISEDPPFKVLAYGEHGDLIRNVLSLRVPVMFIYDEAIDIPKFKNDRGINNSVGVIKVHFFIDENGYGTNIMVFERPHKLYVSDVCNGFYAEAIKSEEPVKISRVYLTRNSCYYNLSNGSISNGCEEDINNFLNGTISIYVDGELVYNGTVPQYSIVDITDKFVSAIKSPYPVVRLVARNCKPTLSAPLNLVIEAEEPWVLVKIIARPAYFILEVGE